MNELKHYQWEYINEQLQKHLSQTSFSSTQLDSKVPFVFYDVEKGNRKKISRICFEKLRNGKNLDEAMISQWLQPIENNLNSKKRIAIVGQAKIGKTQVLMNLLNNVKDEYNFVFYVSLEFINLSTKVNILQFLTTKGSLRWIKPETSDDKVVVPIIVEKLLAKEAKICIILDDLEKANYRFCNFQEKISAFDLSEAGNFVTSILCNEFPYSQKIFLLDSWHFFQLDRENYFKHMDSICVIGIDQAQQRNLFKDKKKKCYRTGCELQSACIGFVTDEHKTQDCSVCKLSYNDNCHLEIQSLCYVPEICKRLKKHHDRNFQPASIVSISASILSEYLMNAFHCCNQPQCSKPKGCSFKKIGLFAWEHYKREVFIFPEESLINDMTPKEINMLFSTRKEHVCNEIEFRFSHILLHELLAALWLLSHDSSRFKKELESIQDPSCFERFKVVIEFMFEISRHPALLNCRSSKIWNIPTSNFTLLKNLAEKN